MFGCFPSCREPQLMVDVVNTFRESFSKNPLLRCASVLYCTEQCICERSAGISWYILGFSGYVLSGNIRETKRNAENDIVNNQY